MKNLFQSSPLVRYRGYEYRKAGEGQFYVTPAAGAKPEVYAPPKDAEQMALDALNVGALQMNRKGRPPSGRRSWSLSAGTGCWAF